MKMEKFAYIGCRTTKERKARGKGISVYKVDGDNWELVQILEGQVNPSYLCIKHRTVCTAYMEIFAR